MMSESTSLKKLLETVPNCGDLLQKNILFTNGLKEELLTRQLLPKQWFKLWKKKRKKGINNKNLKNNRRKRKDLSFKKKKRSRGERTKIIKKLKRRKRKKKRRKNKKNKKKAKVKEDVPVIVTHKDLLKR